MSKIILDHLRESRELLIAYGKAVGIANHGVNIGNAREALISNFLSHNLPPSISYCTGEIFDCEKGRSGQIDILLTPNTSPRLFMHGAIHLIPVDTVFAAIEVKSNLTTGKKSQLSKALINCYKTKELVIANESRHCSPFPSAPFIIFSFSGSSSKKVLENIEQSLSNNSKCLKHAPDIIIVLDKGYYLVKTDGWKYSGATVGSIYKVFTNKEQVLLGFFELLMKLVETLSMNPKTFCLPIDRYTKNLPNNLSHFFDD